MTGALGAPLETLRIRDACPADEPVVRSLWRRSSLSNERDRELLAAHPEVFDVSPELLLAGARVAERDAIVGFSRIRRAGEAVELDALFVEPDAMRTGVGRALVDDVAAAARAAGATTIDVTANEHARPFYERVGFVAVGMVDTPLHVEAPRMRREV